MARDDYPIRKNAPGNRIKYKIAQCLVQFFLWKNDIPAHLFYCNKISVRVYFPHA